METINLATELEFAREFYKQAVEGLEEHEYPPKPDDWLNKADILKHNWEHAKVELIGMYQHADTPEEMKKDIQDFLQCTISLYADLMCSISVLIEKQESGKDMTLKEGIKILGKENVIKLVDVDETNLLSDEAINGTGSTLPLQKINGSSEYPLNKTE